MSTCCLSTRVCWDCLLLEGAPSSLSLLLLDCWLKVDRRLLVYQMCLVWMSIWRLEKVRTNIIQSKWKVEINGYLWQGWLYESQFKIESLCRQSCQSQTRKVTRDREYATSIYLSIIALNKRSLSSVLLQVLQLKADSQTAVMWAYRQFDLHLMLANVDTCSLCLTGMASIYI